jgi:hypothetical protein
MISDKKQKTICYAKKKKQKSSTKAKKEKDMDLEEMNSLEGMEISMSNINININKLGISSNSNTYMSEDNNSNNLNNIKSNLRKTSLETRQKRKRSANNTNMNLTKIEVFFDKEKIAEKEKVTKNQKKSIEDVEMKESIAENENENEYAVMSTKSSLEISAAKEEIRYSICNDVDVNEENIYVSVQTDNYNELKSSDKNSIIEKIRSYINTFTTEELDSLYCIERFMIEEEGSLLVARNPNYFQNHKYINQRMRTILLDWIMEVCGQLSFKRNTYHSAVVLVDVFLTKVENLQTNLLQLTGITCLIIAAKNEVFKILKFYAFCKFYTLYDDIFIIKNNYDSIINKIFRKLLFLLSKPFHIRQILLTPPKKF